MGVDELCADHQIVPVHSYCTYLLKFFPSVNGKESQLRLIDIFRHNNAQHVFRNKMLPSWLTHLLGEVRFKLEELFSLLCISLDFTSDRYKYLVLRRAHWPGKIHVLYLTGTRQCFESCLYIDLQEQQSFNDTDEACRDAS